MKKIWMLVGVVVFLAFTGWLAWPYFAGTVGAQHIETERDVAFLRPNPKGYGLFLSIVVNDDGTVDYVLAKRYEKLLDDYLDQVARATPARFDNDQQRLAFYINAYNALIIAGVLDYWPIESVRDVGLFRAFFRERRYVVAGRRVSFHGFETRVIRRYDARMHFALNCASASCPPLRNEPYEAQQLVRQLADQTRSFINDPKFNRYDPDRHSWQLSAIFAWYAEDFGGEAGIREILSEHAAFAWPEEAATLNYLEYDWALNSH